MLSDCNFCLLLKALKPINVNQLFNLKKSWPPIGLMRLILNSNWGVSSRKRFNYSNITNLQKKNKLQTKKKSLQQKQERSLSRMTSSEFVNLVKGLTEYNVGIAHSIFLFREN